MNKRQKVSSLAVLFILLIVAGFFIKQLDPYGEDYLPQWVEKGNVIIEAVEEHKVQHLSYPKILPVDPKCKDIPGCRKVNYIRNIDKKGKEYFRLTISIHMREAVIYDSRKNLSKSDSWGTYKILNNWMWTKD